MLVFVIPQFAEIYENFQQELPAITKAVLLISNSIIDNTREILAILFPTIFIGIRYKSSISNRLGFLMDFYPILRTSSE